MKPAFDHSQFRDHIDAFVAGALDGADAAAMRLHASGCPTCAAALADAAAQDASIRDAFAAARPRADLEDHLALRFRMNPQPQRRAWVHPTVRRAAVGVAAAVMLGGFGFAANHAVESGGLPTPWASITPAAKSTTQVDLLTEGGGEGDTGGLPLSLQSSAARTPAEMARQYNRSLSDGEDEGARTRYRVATDQQVRTDRRQHSWMQSNAPVAAPSVAARPEAQSSGGYPGVAGQPIDGAAGAADKKSKEDVDRRFGAIVTPDFSLQSASDQAQRGGGSGGAALGAIVPAGPGSDSRGRGSQPANQPADVTAGLGATSGAGVGAFRPDDFLLAYAKEPAGGEKDLDVAAVPESQGANNASTSFKDNVYAAEHVATPAPAQPGTPAPRPAPAPPEAPANTDVAAGRRIIRNGEMSFEVDSFDSSYTQVTKIAGEEGGFVATTDSEKLANGKVRGTVTVRVPPDRLDTLVLKLRGLGDLKSSRLAAQDITKQYTDLESQLRASRAMEERLLNIIKTGKGEIKDLIEAEKQLGVYRERIEQTEGEIRYYANLVSLSTLNVTLTERDIRTAATLSETEQVNMGVEAVDVEKARAAAIQAIDEAKGRVVESDLKKLQAGQFAARVVADVPPDAAGPLIDRMKQIGTVARLEIERKQAAPEGTVAPPAPRDGGAGPRVERRETRFLISLYNLANVAPRQTTSLNLAAEDVEAAYRSVLEQVKYAGGRVVTSQLNRPRPDQTTGTITFEAPSEGADVLLGAVRAAGEVMRLEVSQNPDAQNVTEAKRGFVVQVFSLASVAPRETTSLRVAARGVADAFNKLREAVRAAAGARILSSQLAEQDPANITATLDFEVRRADWATVEAALREAGQVVSRNVSRSADAENTVDTKVRLSLTMTDADRLPPRETTTLGMEVKDVENAKEQIQSLAIALGGRVVESALSREQNGRVMAKVVADVPLGKAVEMVQKTRDVGKVQFRRDARDENVPEGSSARARVDVTLANEELLVESGQGLGSRIREGLRTSVTGLLWSVQLIVVGLFLVAPWALIAWFTWKVIRRGRSRRTGMVPTPA